MRVAHNITSTVTEMGQCRTFNAHEVHVLHSIRTGVQYGADFWINIETYDNIINIQSYDDIQKYDSEVGIKVHFHAQNEIPQVADKGFTVPVGAHCQASISFTKMQQLPYPWGNCK